MRIILILLAGLLSIHGFGQNCDCLANFKFLENKISKDYAGFADKVNSSTIDEYNKIKEIYTLKAQEISSIKRCELLLSKWLEYFNDKHLGLEITKNIYWTFKKIDSTTVLFRIPTFAWEAKPLIDSLIKSNLETISSTPILILDLRGNGGGIDYSYLELLPLIYTHPYESKGAAWWASEGNIRSFEEALENGTIRKGFEEETKELIKALKLNPNTFVTTDKEDSVKRDTVFKYPLKVGVIVNDFCASSCEQFILAAKNSEKTTVFGTNTLGVLDYSNSGTADMPTENIKVRFPKTRSNRLPEYPIDNIGIEPDVRITLPDNLNLKSEVDEWVLFVKEYLEKELEQK
ncbi:MAG: peptidase [Bacteroidetes bacterium]|nr:MAG: peptidase [Bacteroidota bacterium]